MNKIGDITIFNEFTYHKLQKAFEGKKPTNKTILLLRLFAERNINVHEMLILKKEEFPHAKETGVDLMKSTKSNSKLYENVKKLDNNARMRTIDLLNV